MKRVLIMGVLLSLLTGCGASGGIAGEIDKKDATKNIEPPGEIHEIVYDTDTPTVWGARFYADITADEVVKSIYVDESSGELKENEHTDCAPEMWEDIGKLIHALYPLLEEGSDGKKQDLKDTAEALDGGEYSRLTVTWKTSGGRLKEAEYGIPADIRTSTLDALIKETAYPIGREIVWYDPPAIDGVYFRNEKGGYSYQCTTDTGMQGMKRYIAYFYEDSSHKGKQTSVTEKIPESECGELFDYVEVLNLTGLESGTYSDNRTITVYYTDGTQKCYRLDKNTAETLRRFFESFTQRVSDAPRAY